MDCRVTLFLAMTLPWGIVIASLKGVAIHCEPVSEPHPRTRPSRRDGLPRQTIVFLAMTEYCSSKLNNYLICLYEN